jgi:hypothetical protein
MYFVNAAQVDKLLGRGFIAFPDFPNAKKYREASPAVDRVDQPRAEKRRITIHRWAPVLQYNGARSSRPMVGCGDDIDRFILHLTSLYCNVI